jgi:hypothetical protein
MLTLTLGVGWTKGTSSARTYLCRTSSVKHASRSSEESEAQRRTMVSRTGSSTGQAKTSSPQSSAARPSAAEATLVARTSEACRGSWTRLSEVIRETPFPPCSGTAGSFSFLTVDRPTEGENPARHERSFYWEVILPQVNLKSTASDNLYGWLDVMFAFCSGKPVVYYSRYVPSPKVTRLPSATASRLFIARLGGSPSRSCLVTAHSNC